MSGVAVVMMVLITGFVWGGFLFLLVKAVRKEAAKSAHAGASRPPDSTS